MKAFTKRQACAVFICSLLLSHIVWAEDCRKLSSDLDQLSRAQSVIMNDLVENHFQFANAFDDVADEIALSSQKPSPKTIKSMKKTAIAYKKRGQDARQISAGLEEATADLVEKVKACLKK